MKATGYSIKDLEVLSGIKAHTIRMWEKRYGLLEPQRTETNIRYYTDTDLRKMLNVAQLVLKGYKISRIASWSEQKIAETVLSITGQEVTDSDYIHRLILYMVNFDNRGFDRLVDEIIDVFGMEEAFSKIFFNFYIRVGTYWQTGSIFPAQEHYVSSIFRQKLIAAIDETGITNTKECTMLFFLPENEMHEISLLYYAYLAHQLGYNVIYLGQFVPTGDLVKIQEHAKIDYVFTAFINPIQKEDLEAYLVRLKAIFYHQKIFITGGQLKIHQPEVPRNVKMVKDYHVFKRYLK